MAYIVYCLLLWIDVNAVSIYTASLMRIILYELRICAFIGLLSCGGSPGCAEDFRMSGELSLSGGASRAEPSLMMQTNSVAD